MQNKLIEGIYKILLLYEDVLDSKHTINEQDYLKYLNRLYVYWLGEGNREIFCTIKGLQSLGMGAEHNTVKSMVFYMIDLIKGA